MVTLPIIYNLIKYNIIDNIWETEISIKLNLYIRIYC